MLYFDQGCNANFTNGSNASGTNGGWYFENSSVPLDIDGAIQDLDGDGVCGLAVI